MAYGLYSLNDAGSVLLTDYLLSYNLVSVHTLTSGANPFSADLNASTQSMVSFAYTGTQPIVAYRSTSRIAMYQNVKTSANNWTANIMVADAPGVTVYAYVFEAVTNTSSGGFGLDIFDPSAQRVYSINAKPMRIVGVATGPGNYNTYPTGVYAVASSLFTFRYSVTDTGRSGSLRYLNYWYSYGANMTDTGPVIGSQTIRNYTSSSPGYVAKNFGIENKLIIDVTNY